MCWSVGWMKARRGRQSCSARLEVEVLHTAEVRRALLDPAAWAHSRSLVVRTTNHAQSRGNSKCGTGAGRPADRRRLGSSGREFESPQPDDVDCRGEPNAGCEADRQTHRKLLHWLRTSGRGQQRCRRYTTRSISQTTPCTSRQPRYMTASTIMIQKLIGGGGTSSLSAGSAIACSGRCSSVTPTSSTYAGPQSAAGYRRSRTLGGAGSR